MLYDSIQTMCLEYVNPGDRAQLLAAGAEGRGTWEKLLHRYGISIWDKGNVQPDKSGGWTL